MKLLDDAYIKQLILVTGYHFDEENYYNLDNHQLKELFIYATFLDENKSSIMSIANVSEESILYSRYYWWYRFKCRNEQLIGSDDSFDQKLDDILYEMDYSIPMGVDFNLLQKIEEMINNGIFDLSIFAE